MKKIISIIPARGGSKTIPKKNIKLLNGKPLIYYTMKEAQKSRYLDRIIVSTDDEKIAKIAKEYNAEVPFLRPKELAQDNTPDLPVFKNALKWLEKNESYKPDIILNLRPTTPLRKVEDINKVIEKILETDCDSVRTVSLVEQHPYWMKKVDGDRAYPLIENKDETKYFQRQLLPPVYIINGCVDAMKRNNIMNNSLYGDDMSVIIIPKKRSIDIDNIINFKLAEIILKEGYL